MKKKKLFFSVFFVLVAFGVLFISILRSASVRYSLNTQVISTYTQNGVLPTDVDYGLVYSGSVLPGSWLWPVKALRDRVWVLMTVDMTKKMELYLLLADKRLGAARVLFSQKKYDLAVSTLTKAEGYLKNASMAETVARTDGVDTKHFVYKLLLASFKHRELIRSFQDLVPDDVRTQLVMIENYPRGLYGEKANLLESPTGEVLKDPYAGQ